VRFAGWRVDVPELLPAIDVFVMPSLWEACSIGLLEAMAAQRPIVVTDVADHRSFIRDGVDGLIIRSRDPQAIVEAVGSCLDNPIRAAEMGRSAGRRFAEQFTVAHMARQYESLYLDMVCPGAMPVNTASAVDG
jgi:glycosyltransferase involved in cell wall biosynthesis